MRLKCLPFPLTAPAIAESEGAYQFQQVRGLLGKRLRRR
jgi:hypothetical protein